jgi:hypothetical protein
MGPNEKGEFEYEGETKVDWNSQTTKVDRNDLVTLECDEGHDWQASELKEEER